jgi:hypothetical protein
MSPKRGSTPSQQPMLDITKTMKKRIIATLRRPVNVEAPGYRVAKGPPRAISPAVDGRHPSSRRASPVGRTCPSPLTLNTGKTVSKRSISPRNYSSNSGSLYYSFKSSKE